MSLTRQSYIGSFLGTDHRLLISLFEGMTLLLRKSSAQARSKAGTRAIETQVEVVRTADP